MDWSRTVVRASPGFTIDFDITSTNGSVAKARARRGSARERYLSIDEIALLTAVKKPAPVPDALRRRIRDCEQVLAGLVLDGLVEVREGGRFLSGAAALQRAEEPAASHATGPAAHVSGLALEYALALRHIDPAELGKRLYAFNSLPLREARRADFAGRTGIDPSSPTVRLGGHDWTPQAVPSWLYLRRNSGSGGRFKIYLSPAIADIPKVLDGFATVLGRKDATFKIAFPSHSLKRPDKIVAYFPTFAALQQGLSDLAGAALEGRVQAVPFSAPVAGAPLLSWGVDPPGMASRGHASWRSWVAGQVAECAHGIEQSAGPDEALVHLKTALELRGIDAARWLPSQQLISQKWRLEL